MQISDEVIKILEYLGQKIGVTIDWTSNNVLPYVEQLCKKFIVWETSTSYAWIAIAGGIFVIALIFAILVSWLSDLDGFEWVIFAVVAVVTIAIIGCQVFDILECQTFPEKAIYDYIQFHIGSGSR